ncbi:MULTISPECIES: TonB-dependent receptor domain-containing protein [Sphingomonas]|uniref:Outer membrane receptor protein involved in Fe transport n=1 Tax=Sphingomonas trueperi TaxID=53317 RepID=A0A7X5XXA8_9SPHN|nr:TonB-dependent receptor [Sphingomonas sp. ABOLD]NJB96792.1 outer membrane receptor protein involved in Fe transport [Sphingomonas trueperi]
MPLRAGTVLAGMGAVAFFAAPAFAQDQNGAADAAQQGAGTEIVVTGSRIARPDLQSSTPVAVVSAERIEQTGASNIQDVLATLPSVGQNVSRTSSNFSNTGNGTATVNLRNLGSSRTLVLIDGRRTLGIAGSPAVDVNNIPTDLVQRVEVVTGGASAVYGSEAIAGVVNFVLKNDFQGLRVRAQNTLSDKGDAARQYVSITGGQNFGGGRGNVTANFSYDNDHGLYSRDRSFSARDLPNRSAYASQGVFDVSGPNQQSFTPNSPSTFTFGPGNNLKGYQGPNIDGYNRNGDRLLSVPVERYQGAVLAHYDFSDAFKLYAQGQYSRTNSNASLEPAAISNTGPSAALNFDGSAYAGIPISSPYVPAAIRAAAIANGVDTIQFLRRSNDIFSRSNKNERDFYRGVLGAKGQFTAGTNWSYDIYYEHSESRDHTTAQSIYTPNYGAALSNEIGPDGQVRCSDTAARAAGCVPINIFGANTVTAAAAQFLQKYTGPTRNVTLVDGGTVQLVNGTNVAYDYLAKVNQDVVSGSINGDLFSLWGGPVALSFGGEYRHEKSTETFDPFTQAGLSAGNQITNTRGSFNVKEGFVEVVAPIVEDRPGLKYLGLEGAARYADYSTVVGVWSFKGGATFAPTSDIRFRGVYSRATRAPNIGELYASISQTFPSVNDPCDQGTNESDKIPAACANVPGRANTIASRGSFTYSTAQIQSIDGLLGGNRNLREETADTFTAGAVITPTFFKNFSMTVDYYTIKVKNAIGIIGQQVSADECLATGNAQFCNNVIRDSNGFITRVNAINFNTGSYLVSGIDVEARYAVPVGASRFDFDVMYNHRFKQQQTPFPGAAPQNELGQADCYSCGRLGSGFKDKGVANVTFSAPKFQLNYRLDYMGPLVDNLASANPQRISAYFYHNLQGKVMVGGKQQMELYAGVNNLLDTKPPVFGDTNQVTFPGTQTVANTYDLYGRMLYVGATFKF